jgi:hypothetical protein
MEVSRKNLASQSRGDAHRPSVKHRLTKTLIVILFLSLAYIPGKEHKLCIFQKETSPACKDSPLSASAVSIVPPVNAAENEVRSVLQVEMVDVVKGVVKGRHWGALSGKYLLPAVSFSLKNQGPDLNGFFVHFRFDDLDNKKQLVIYNEYIDPMTSGWVSQSKTSYLHYQRIDNKLKPDFKVGLKAYIDTRSGPHILYETIFDPQELQTLPEVDK